jgi:hypothetical protein
LARQQRHRHRKGGTLKTDFEPQLANRIQGQLLRQSERREVAIFLQNGALWVADFIDGEGMLIDATTWFRFNCAALASPHAQRRMVLESAIPQSPDLVARIGRLCDPARTPKRGALVWLLVATSAFRARRRWVAAAVRVFIRHRANRYDQPM